MRRIISVFAAIVLLFIAGRASSEPPATLRIAFVPGDIGAQCWYANDLGYFRDAGINVELTPITNGGAVSAAVASKAIDIGFSAVATIAIARERGIPFVIIAPANAHVASAPNAALLVVTPASTIRTGKDLEGKTVAISGLNSAIHFAVRAWIDSHGGDSAKVHFVELPLAEQPAAVRSGRVDAAAIDSLRDPDLGKPGDSLRLVASTFNSISPNFVPSVWFTTEDWVKEHPDLVKTFAAVIERTSKWANTHRHESAEILAKHTTLTVPQLDSITRVTYGTTVNAALVQPNIDVAARYGTLKAAFPATTMISKLVGGSL